MSKNTIWMYVTDDKYELPIYIGDSCKELAEILGVKENLILCDRSRRKREGKKSRYLKINIKGDDRK